MTAKDEAPHTQGEVTVRKSSQVDVWYIEATYRGEGVWLVAEVAGRGGIENQANAERLARAWNSLSPNEARIAELEEALREALEYISRGRKGSIGSIESHYLPQVPVERVEQWALVAAKAEGSHD